MSEKKEFFKKDNKPIKTMDGKNLVVIFENGTEQKFSTKEEYIAFLKSYSKK